jgi:nucleotide-binding universal stress UspA family protein
MRRANMPSPSLNVYQRVLLCYDGSSESRNALRHGGDLVAALKCETHILLVSNVFYRAAAHSVVVEGSFDAERSACDTTLKEGLGWLRQRGVDATPHVVLGQPSEVIPRVARELYVDLIVVGHTPRSRFARWWAGPENASLLDCAHCSVLIALGD